jgi:hypothetical protein
MASVAAVLMTVMIGISGSNSRPPVPVKETTIIEGSSSMSVCRALEASFHIGAVTVDGERKISTEKYGTTGNDIVRRESTCRQITL